MPLILSLQTFHNKSPVQTEGFCPLKHYIISIRRALKELRGYSRNLDHLWRNLSLSHSLPYLALLSNLNFPACLLSRTLSISVQLPPCISFCISSVISSRWIPLCFCARLHTTVNRWATQKFEVSKNIPLWLILQPCMLYYRIIYTINISNISCVLSPQDQSVSFFFTQLTFM